MADRPVKPLKDLKGRKVGYSVSGFEDAVLGAMLESVGLSLKDVELINVNFALTAALPEQRGGFLAVLWYAAAWQAASFLAIRLLVREGT